MIFPSFSCCRLSIAFVAAFSGALGSPGSLFAAQPQSAPAAGHIRIWKADLRGFPELSVLLTPAFGKRPEPHELCKSGPGYLFENYVELPAGNYAVDVGPDSKHPLAKTNISLAPNGFMTVIVHEPSPASGPLQLEIVDDGPTDHARGPGHMQLTVRSFVSGLSDVNINIGNSVKAQFPGSDDFLQVRGLKADIYAIHTVGKTTDGKPFEWDSDTDLRSFHHQTMLIYPDAYGRIRPRLIVDSEVPEEPLASKDSQGQR